jgi:hypothetical protein
MRLTVCSNSAGPQFRLEYQCSGNARNWLIGTNQDNSGDFVIRQSTVAGCDAGGTCSALRFSICPSGVANFASNVCANSLVTIGGGLNENFNATGGGHINRYFAVKYIPENTTQAFFKITTSGASATHVQLVATNPGVGWFTSQLYHSAITAYWGGWIGSGTEISRTSNGAGHISGVHNDASGGQTYCVIVGNNGTSTQSLIFAYITVITYAGYSAGFTQL